MDGERVWKLLEGCEGAQGGWTGVKKKGLGGGNVMHKGSRALVHFWYTIKMRKKISKNISGGARLHNLTVFVYQRLGHAMFHTSIIWCFYPLEPTFLTMYELFS